MHHVWATLDSKLVGNGYHQELVRELRLASLGAGLDKLWRRGEMEGEVEGRRENNNNNLPALIVVENVTRDIYVDLDQVI